jgi:mxaK protein
MKRTTVHAVFAVAALACAVFAGAEAIRLVKAQRVNDEVAGLAAASAAAPAASSGIAAAASSTDTIDSLAPRPVQLAQAVALAAQRRYDAAGRRFEVLIENGVHDETGRAALFDLANMYLREGAGASDDAGTSRSAPMIEQAKARYRALLRMTPDDWDARYNLERALRLAPEQPSEAAAEVATKSRIKLRGAQSEDLP